MSKQQLILPIGSQEQYLFENYVAGDNKELLDHLQSVVSGAFSLGTNKPLSLISGKQGMGKTHLLCACFEAAQKQQLSCSFLDLSDFEQLDSVLLDGLEHQRFVLLDNIHCLQGNNGWEEALFDLINRVIESGSSYLLATSCLSHQLLHFTLPDLASRLSWGTNYQIQEMNTEQQHSFLAAKAKDRGFSIPPEVAQYLLNRLPRDVVTLKNIVEQLDELSLQSQRKLTIPFVKEVFKLT